MDFVQTLPNNISKQILAGLEYTKKKMPTDLVATTVDVTGPQVTPPGSPIDGQVAKSAGAPVEKYITPRNGALMAVGDGSGYAGCSTTDMTGCGPNEVCSDGVCVPRIG